MLDQPPALPDPSLDQPSLLSTEGAPLPPGAPDSGDTYPPESIEEGQGETEAWLLTTVQSMTPAQQAFLGAIRQRRRDSLAIQLAHVDPPTLTRWRKDEAFAQCETLLRARAWGLGPRLARELAQAVTPRAVLADAHDMTHGKHWHERRGARDAVYEVGGLTGRQGVAPAGGITETVSLRYGPDGRLLERSASRTDTRAAPEEERGNVPHPDRP